MRDILADLERWRKEEKQIALATVVDTWGSAPRAVGAKMALTPDEEITGSVSGGCVEGAVYQAGVEALESGKAQLLHYGVADETAWEVGLACGGKIEIFVQPLSTDMYDQLQQGLAASRPMAFVNVIQGPEALLGKGMLVVQGEESYGSMSESLHPQALLLAREALANGVSKRVMLPTEDEGPLELFIDVIPAPPNLVMVGGVHIAIALAKLARVMDYQTIVVDPRRSFGNPDRFPEVGELIQEWPNEAFSHIAITNSTALVMLTHDPKIDDPALQIALNSDAFYIGALGSKSTQAKRRKRLLAGGIEEVKLERLHAPIGLRIGGKTPEEIALAIMAEIISVQYEKD
ncbi:MAG: XdhC family protein [Chloroflexi bacterium]|nr:XdhC family protein [Chloroflexota bacterium]